MLLLSANPPRGFVHPCLCLTVQTVSILRSSVSLAPTQILPLRLPLSIYDSFRFILFNLAAPQVLPFGDTLLYLLKSSLKKYALLSHLEKTQFS